MDDVTKTRKNLGYFTKQIENRLRVSVREGNVNDAIPTRKKYQKILGYASYAFFPVEMTSFKFLSQHRNTQAIFYLLNL